MKNISRKQRKRLYIKFFTVMLGSLGSFTLLFSVVVLAFFIPNYYHYVSGGSGIVLIDDETRGNTGMLQRIVQNQAQVPVRTTFVVLGLDDEDYGADAVVVGVFNRLTGAIDLINIPRDTFLNVTPASQQLMRDANRRFNNPTKVADVARHAGRALAPQVMINELEELLNITIDYYISMDLDAFVEVVDIFGPIPFTVPRRMFYNDGFGLVIDLQPGFQYLDGQRSEWLIRYRATYARGDIQRIEMQQEFMSAMFGHVMQRDNLFNINNIISLVGTIIRHVDTNFPITSVAMYVPYLPSIDLGSLNMHTMPGDPNGMINRISFVFPFHDEIRVLTNQLFHGIYPVVEYDEVDDELEVLTLVQEPSTISN